MRRTPAPNTRPIEILAILGIPGLYWIYANLGGLFGLTARDLMKNGSAACIVYNVFAFCVFIVVIGPGLSALGKLKAYLKHQEETKP